MKTINKRWHHITKSERKEIALYLAKGYSQADIARMTKRSKSTISDEIRRKVKGVYDPEKANHKAYVRRKYAKYQGMKVVSRDDLRRYVAEKLRLDWSPEQIAGRISRSRCSPTTHLNRWRLQIHLQLLRRSVSPLPPLCGQEQEEKRRCENSPSCGKNLHRPEAEKH